MNKSIKLENSLEKRNVSTILRAVLNYEQEVIKKLGLNQPNDEDARINLNKELEKKVFYRGESQYYDYRVPTLYRNDKLSIKGSEKYYRMLLTELGRDDFLENISLVSTISELQHYGAKTRMVDITTNLLVAIFFAVEKHDDKPGYIYIYGDNDENIKFDSGHTVAIKSALNFIDQKIINNYIKACESIVYFFDDKKNDYHYFTIDEAMEKIKSDKVMEKIKSFKSDEFNKCFKDIEKFMMLLNQRTKTREVLVYPFRIFEDISKSHIVIPTKKTDRIRQQQGAFIYPPHYFIDETNYSDLKEKIGISINELSYEMIANEENKDENIEKKRIYKNFTCIMIPGGYKKTIRKELKKIGITSAYIYPGIEKQSDTILEDY